ncbi:MAG: alpha/beta fold hydrolase, partial [Roseiflexaceae bacterium]
LVIHGSRDTALLTSSHAENQRWVHQPITFHLLDAGHFVHQECPDVVNQTVLEWLATASVPTPTSPP